MSDVTTAFIGLGNMGFPMAGHLVAAGHAVTAYNRTEATGARWHDRHGAPVAATPAEAARRADVVFVCVGNDDDVRSVTTGTDGCLATMAEGSILVDHTTASAELAREIYAAAAEVGVGFVDAPISGGQSGAEAGQLSVMCGGDAGVFERAAPVIDAYAKSVTLIGPNGSGQLTKMVNQILCAGAIHGAAEALNFGIAAGLDMELVLQAVTGGAANSWYLENRGQTMVADEFDFGFAVDWMHKDLAICRAEAERLGVPSPLTELMLTELAVAQQRGENRLDATAVIRQLRDAS